VIKEIAKTLEIEKHKIKQMKKNKNTLVLKT